MADDPGLAPFGPSETGPGKPMSSPPDELSEQLARLSDLFTATFQQLTEFAVSMARRAAGCEQREADLAARAAALDEREQQLRLSRQDLDVQRREHQAAVEALAAEREQFEQLRADVRRKLDDFAEQQRLVDAERTAGARRVEEFAARESLIAQREHAITAFQQAFARIVAAFDEDPGVPASPGGCATRSAAG